MRHGRANYKLGRVTSHRWALFRNLLVALFRGVGSEGGADKSQQHGEGTAGRSCKSHHIPPF